jgi:hypothetical protein
VAEQERLTNKERRERGREERKRKEAEQAKQAKKGQLKGAAITAAIVLVVGAVVFQAVAGGPTAIEDGRLVSFDAADDAREAAGCEQLAEREPLSERYHFEPSSQPDPASIYTDTRPTHSGPHVVNVNPVGTFSSQVDERASTHNLEHGSVIAWYDPESVDDADAIEEWVETLNASGFEARAGAGIISAPFEEPALPEGDTIALRAWGTALNCETWSPEVADAFVVENYGTRGIGPERTFAGYPEGVLEFEDRDVEETSDQEAPIEGEEPPTADEEELEDEVGEDNVDDTEGESDDTEDPPEPDPSDDDS